MALDIQPVNYASLAQLAGKSNPLGNLQPTGALGLQALQQMQAASASQRSDATNRMQIQQQGQLSLGQQNIQRQQLAQQAAQQDRQGLFQDRELGLKQQQLGQQNALGQAELAMKQDQLGHQNALGQSELALKKQALEQDGMKMSMAKLMEEKKEIIQAKGAFASYGLMSLEGAKTPEEAQQISNEIFKEAASKGYLTKSEAEQMNQLPLSQRKNAMKMMIMNLGMTKEHKDMQDKAAPAGGNSTIRLPDGTVVTSSAPTTPVKGEAQKKVSGAENNLRELSWLRENVDDSYFGATSAKYWVNNVKEGGQSLPIIGDAIRPSDEDKAALRKYSDAEGKIQNLSMNIIKELSGLSYTDKQLEFMNEIVPHIGPTATRTKFEGKLDNLERYFSQVKQANQDILKSGIIVEGSEEHKQALLDKMRNVLPKSEKSSSGGFTKEQIEAEKKRRGL